MLQSTFILLLVATMLISTQASLKFKSWGNVTVATIDSGLYAVSKNQTHISIQSNVTSHQCDLVFNNTHVGKIQVAGIESKILLLFRLNSTIIQMLQLDPILCLYTPLPNLKTSGESSFEPQLIVLGDTLDVFVKNDSNCLPCRLDINGNRLDVTGQLKESKSPFFKSFIVEEFIQKGVVRNYVLAGNFYNGSSVLMVLNHNFIRTKDTYFAYQIETLAANSVPNQISLIGITYAGLGSPYKRVLAMYTDDLKLLYETQVEPDVGYRILHTLLSINSRGRAFVYYQQTIPSSNRRMFSYAIYNLVGRLDARGDHTNLLADIKHDWQLLRRNNYICYVLHWEEKPSTMTDVSCYL